MSEAHQQKASDEPGAATTANGGEEKPAQLSWHGEVDTNNYESVVKHNAKYKEMRMDALKIVMEIFAEAKVRYWLDCGSLLGAWRDNKIMPHDFDIDLSILGEEDFERARAALTRNLPKRYSVQHGTEYADKLEVDDDESGTYTLPDGVVWPNVSIDINKYVQREDGTLKQLYHNYNLAERRYQLEWLLPFSDILFEGVWLPCPREIEPYLEEMYGYLGTDFKYDPVSMKFVQKDTVLSQ